ncbi:MAG: hypothetical protein U9R36_01115 [Elusimicrobiota bacterium]|nr:hypothetical protein [Elusimicrobiota bacterium]
MIAGLIVVFLLIWGIGYRFRMPAVRGKTLLTYVPSESPGGKLAAVAGINNVKDIYKDIQKTNFYKSLIESNLSSLKNIKEKKFDAEVSDIMNVIGRQFVGAVYSASPEAKYIVIGKIRDPEKVSSVVNALSDSEIAADEHNGAGIGTYKEKGFYTFFREHIIAGNSLELVKESMDLISGDDSITNFNALYPHIEEEMDPGADGYLFTQNKELAKIADEYSNKELPSSALDKAGRAYTYREFFLNKGLYVKSVSYSDRYKEVSSKSGESPSATLNLVPQRPLFAGAVNKAGQLADSGKIAGSDMLPRELYIDIKDKIIENVDGEIGYVLLGPSKESADSLLPGMGIYLRASSAESAGKIAEYVKSMLGSQMSSKEYSGVPYSDVLVPLLFGQKINISLATVKYKGNIYVVIASPAESLYKIIDISGGNSRSLKESPEWRGVVKFLPDNYSSYSYVDANAISNTVGVFIARLRRDEALENFLESSPLSWIGPSGSAVTLNKESTAVHTYIPMQDLDREKWDEIISSFIPVVK